MTVYNIFSNSALCGSALEISATRFEISYSNFYDNRYQASENFIFHGQPWSDGITAVGCENGHIHDNYFEDNTDVDLILGPGHGCSVHDNRIRHRNRYAYAGLMLGFGGDHSGSEVRDNWVTSGLNVLSIGLMVGTHPWALYDRDQFGNIIRDLTLTDAGNIHDNHINGAVTFMWIDGIDAGNVTGNELLNRQGTNSLFNCQSRPVYAVQHAGAATVQLAPEFPVPIVFDETQCHWP